MVHISIKLFLKDIKTKGQLNEGGKKKPGPQKGLMKLWYNHILECQTKVTFQMYKSNKKYKCHKQLDGHKYILHQNSQVKKNTYCIPLTENYKRTKKH